MSTLYTPTILNSELNYLMILVNLILLSKICYYMSAYNILPINIYDSNWQFCYCKLFVKRAFSVMTPKLLFKIVFAPPFNLALNCPPCHYKPTCMAVQIELLVCASITLWTSRYHIQ